MGFGGWRWIAEKDGGAWLMMPILQRSQVQTGGNEGNTWDWLNSFCGCYLGIIS